MYCAMMCNKSVVHVISEFYATMPGLDTFVTMEKSQRIRNFLEVIIILTIYIKIKNIITKRQTHNKYISV